MIEFINEYLPSVIAGLIPSVLTFGTTAVIFFKNLTVNKNFDNLSLTVNSLIKKEIDLEEALTSATKDINVIVRQLKGELESLITDFKKDFKDDIYNLNEKVESIKKEIENTTNEKIKEIKRKIGD